MRPCEICGRSDCSHWPEVPSPLTVTDWDKRPVPNVRTGAGIPAPDRIWEDDRLVYAAGDVVPFDHAVRLGLITSEDMPATVSAELEKPSAVTAEDTAAARTAARVRRQTAHRDTGGAP